MSEKFIGAAKDGYLDMLREAQRKDLNAPDENGCTATHWAALNGNLEALRMIVGRGGDVNKCDYQGNTALHHAARRGHMDVVSYLVNWGCNLFALDNDYHSALDIASLNERPEVMKFLDTVYAQQQAKNPKIVSKLREDGIRNAERNIKRYEKLQEEASRRAEKEQKKIIEREHHAENQFKPPGKKNFFKTLTVKLRGGTTNKNKQEGYGTSKTYSAMTGMYGIKSGVAKKVSQKRESSSSLGDGAFKVSEVDESGRRMVKTMSNGQGIRSATSDVMYMTNSRDNFSNEASSSRPALSEIFGQNGMRLTKAKSESDLLGDSGVESYFSEHDEDEEEKGGVFWRPGFGNTAFLIKSPFVNTLQSFEGDDSNGGNMFVNGIDGDVDLDTDKSSYSHHGDGADFLAERMKDLPWDQDEVEELDDDDDDESGFSALEMFLVSSGLTSYIPYFTKEKIDMELLMKISDHDLKEEIGLPFGPRKRLQEAIERRRKILDTPQQISDSFL